MNKNDHKKKKLRWFLLGVLILYAWKHKTGESPKPDEKEPGLSGFDDYY